jgi:hypothetical protein
MEAYAKYLCLAGHKVSVLTEGEQDENCIWEGCNISYIKERENFIHLRFYETDSVIWHKIKAGLNHLSNQIFLDKKPFWRKKALKKALKIVTEENISVMLSTYGYLSPHLMALKIKKINKEIKWIADFRDEMSTDPAFLKLTQYRLKKIEKKILNTTDLVVSISKPIIHDLKSNSNKDNFLEINNGYDFEESKECSFQQYFTLSYIGSFFGIKKPDNLFYALKELKEQYKIPSNFVLKLIGNQKYLDIPDSIRDNVIEKGKIPHDKAIDEMKKSDVLLMIQPTSIQKGIYTGKLFEYLAINKNILALIDTDDVAAQLIEATNSGISVDNSDIDNIKKAICELYDRWINKISPSKEWDLIKEFSREKQVQKLVDYLKFFPK